MRVTSRRRLVGLESTHIVSLDVLPESDAVALFTGIVGDSRTDDARAVGEIVEQCGHLPLAIRLAAARLRARSSWSVRYLAGRLRQACWPLAELEGGDSSVAAAFTLSYQDLTPAAQRMFRLLGLHPGPDFDAPAAAALAAVDLCEAERLLETLVDDHLLQQTAADRYRFHDLLRRHACTTASAEESEPDRLAALGRMVDFYLHTAYRGSRLFAGPHPPIKLDRTPAGCVPDPLPDATAAMIWFANNHSCVLGAQATAERAGWDAKVWQLAWTVDRFQQRHGLLHATVACWRSGLAAAERLGDLHAQARAHRRLGLVYAPLGESGQAFQHLKESLRLSEEIGDHYGQAGVHYVLALAWLWENDYGQALSHATTAHRLNRELANDIWAARALSMVGLCQAHLGHHEVAGVACRTALTLCREFDDRYGEADSLDGLGLIANATGEHSEALDHYQRALMCWRDLGNIYRQAGTLARIGDAHRDLGRPEPARNAWQEAIDLYHAKNLIAPANRVRERFTDPH